MEERVTATQVVVGLTLLVVVWGLFSLLEVLVG